MTEIKNKNLNKLHSLIQQSFVYILAAVLIIGSAWAVRVINNLMAQLNKVDTIAITVKEFESKNLIKDAERDIRIQRQLAELRVKVNGTRTLIFLFHNSGHWSTGSTMKKYSAAYESTSTGYALVSDRLQNILLSQNIGVAKILASESETTVIHVDDMRVTPAAYARMENLGVRTIMARPLIVDGIPIGILTIHYAYDYEPTEEDLEVFKVYEARIDAEFQRGMIPRSEIE